MEVLATTVDNKEFRIKVHDSGYPGCVHAKISKPEFLKWMPVHAPHIPYFAMNHRLRYFESGKPTQRCMDAIKDNLESAIEKRKFFEEHRDEIYQSYLRIRFLTLLHFSRTGFMNKAQFSIDRHSLRRALKTGKISAQEFQQTLNQNRRKLQNYETYKTQCKNRLIDHLDDQFGMFFSIAEIESYCRHYLGLEL